MKTQKIANRLTLVAAAMIGSLFFTGCDKESTSNDAPIPEGALKISVEKPYTDSKTTVEGVAVYWTEGDQVNINGTPYTVQFSSGTPYLMDVPNDAIRYAGFPSEIFSTVGSTIIATIPDSYNYESLDGLQKLDLPMVSFADANAESMTFFHLCATVNVKITNILGATYYVDTITVTSNSKPLCGDISVNPSTIAITEPSYSDNTKSVTMSFAKNTVSIAASANQSFQIPVLRTNGSSTISVRIVGHAASGANFNTGKIDAAAKIIYNNSATATLGRAQFFTAPCSMKTGIGAVTLDYPVFSVSSSNKVCFSHGNLQYKASNTTWQFATTQYSTIGNNNLNISDSYDGWIDLFGWAPKNHPTLTINNNANYTNWADWSSGSILNTTGNWRGLTATEMNYLFNTRTSHTTVNGTANARYTKAIVNGVKGVIIFPDKCDIPTLNESTWGAINSASSNYTATISTTDWNLLESCGCVFMPATGLRNVDLMQNPEFGYYWSKTESTDDNNKASYWYMSTGAFNLDTKAKHVGRAVRLVQDAN